MVEANGEAFFKRGPALCSAVGFDGHLKLFNPAFQRAFGWSREELLGSFYLDLVHPADAQRARATFAAALDGREGHISVRVRNVDGSYRWTEWRSSTDMKGRVIYGIGNEVPGGPRLAGGAGYESDSPVRVLLDRSPVGIAMSDRDGRILEANAALCDLLGYSREELLGRELSALIGEDGRARHVAALRELFTGKDSSYEAFETYLSADGNPGKTRLEVDVVRDGDGSPLYYVSHWHPGDRAPRPDRASGPSPTPRELDVLRLAAEGLSTEEMATRLEVSPTTVKTHLKNLYAKMGVSNRAGAVAEALRRKLI
jgi:PAS domain S-box-containing protein